MKSTVIAAMLLLLTLYAAPPAQSPLGLRYPLGIPDLAVTGAAAAMGGSGTAVTSEFWGTSLNPANAAIGPRSMFSAMVSFDMTNISEGDSSSSVSGYMPKLLALIIPIGRAGNLSFSMQKRCDANLNFQTTADLQQDSRYWLPEGSSKTASIEHVRKGGLTAWQAGWAYRFGNGFGLGLAYERFYYNRNYRDKFESEFKYDGSEPFLTSVVETVTSNFASDGIRFGVQVPVHEKVTLAAAAEYILQGGDNLRVTRDYYRTGRDEPALTIRDSTEKTFSVDLPPSINIGVAYAANDHWLLAADAHSTLWEFYKNTFENTEAQRVYGVSAGARFVPTANKLGAAYWEIIHYSAGIRYTTLPQLTQQDNAKSGAHEYAFSLGVSLPIPNDGGTVDLAFDIGRRTDARYKEYSENVVKFQLGINGGRNWFQQDASRR